MKSAEEILQTLQAQFGEEAIVASDLTVVQPWIALAPNHLLPICQFLRDTPEFYFDFLSCLSGVDEGPVAGRMGVVYHLFSIPYQHRIVLKCFVTREIPTVEIETRPTIPSLAVVWRTTDWHEREAYDLFGIWFEGHPDLRRILMPQDWEGHPLRKDYVNPEFYHGIQTAY